MASRNFEKATYLHFARSVGMHALTLSSPGSPLAEKSIFTSPLSNTCTLCTPESRSICWRSILADAFRASRGGESYPALAERREIRLGVPGSEGCQSLWHAPDRTPQLGLVV
eukprot:COSAG02_NODE_2529_length_8602_cov_20.688463_4_plen_112_part_00